MPSAGGTTAYFGKRSGPGPGSWHQGPTLSTYFQGATIRAIFLHPTWKYQTSVRLTRPFQRAYQIPIMFHQRKPKTKVVTKLIRAMMAPFLHQVP